jgi:hypothetical protein
MKTHKMTYRLTAIALVATVASGLAVACSGDDNNGNPTPTVDSGTGSDVTTQGDTSTGGDSTTSTDTGTSTTDGPSLDTGSCKSDASTCNSCYNSTQAAADPYNACSQYTTSCVPFTGTVPTHPTL